MAPRIIAFVLIEVGLLILVTAGVVLPRAQIFTLGRPEILALIGQMLWPPLCFFAASHSSDCYSIRVIRSMREFYTRLPRMLLTASLLLVLVSLFVSIPLLVSSSLFSSVLLMVIYAGAVLPLRWGLYTFGDCGLFAERILVLGTGELARKVESAVRTLSPLGYVIAGFVDDSERREQEQPLQALSPILGSLSQVEQIIEQFRPNRIIVALRERRSQMPLAMLLKAHWEGVIVENGIDLFERSSGKLAVENLTPGFLIFSTNFKKSWFDAFLRRGMSMLLALLGIVIAGPLLLLIALAIKLDSSGPVFFIQERAGLHGRIFRLVKFRTMHTAPENKEQALVWERDIESRVTRMGRWLRMTHLDESPQFFNILRGDMGFVGPRPEMAGNIQAMEEEIPYYSLRMAVRPGLTGLAQIEQGYAVSQDAVTEKIRYDLYYIKHRSFWLDCRILIDTIKLILLGKENLQSLLKNESSGEKIESSKQNPAILKLTKRSASVSSVKVLQELNVDVEEEHSANLFGQG